MKNQILILTHGKFSEGINTSLKVITGERDSIDYICLMEEDSVETIKCRLKNWLEKNNPQKPSLILTDIPFGSTTTIAAQFINTYPNLHLISGLNLGMLLTLVTSELNLENINFKIKESIDQGVHSISYINNVINNNLEMEDDF